MKKHHNLQCPQTMNQHCMHSTIVNTSVQSIKVILHVLDAMTLAYFSSLLNIHFKYCIHGNQPILPWDLNPRGSIKAAQSNGSSLQPSRIISLFSDTSVISFYKSCPLCSIPSTLNLIPRPAIKALM